MPTPLPPHKIAVIGGGASAALFVAALPAGNIAVDIYDRTGQFGRGIAYSTRDNAHLLNVRAGNMSALHADKNHFSRWAAAFGYGADDFVPRRLYGKYLEEIMLAAKDKFAVTPLTEDVTIAIRKGMGFTVQGRDYDDVILATGNVAPLGPKTDGNITGYFPDPWVVTADNVRGAKQIALIGTGLTAVDMVLSLISFGFDGKITMISRRGLLPAVHTDPAAWPHPPLSAEDADKPLSHLIGMVRMHVREAATQNVPWQAVIDSLRPVTNPIWFRFTEPQRAQFNKHLLTLWNIHRHRMAPSIAQQVQAWRTAGRLSIMKESVHSIGPGPVVVSAKGTYAFDAIINCMGYRYQERGRIFDYSHAIGPARFGDLFETTAIPEIRTQAHDIAAIIGK